MPISHKYFYARNFISSAQPHSPKEEVTRVGFRLSRQLDAWGAMAPPTDWGLGHAGGVTPRGEAQLVPWTPSCCWRPREWWRSRPCLPGALCPGPSEPPPAPGLFLPPSAVSQNWAHTTENKVLGCQHTTPLALYAPGPPWPFALQASTTLTTCSLGLKPAGWRGHSSPQGYHLVPTAIT